jgi:hypothetical protein
VRWALAWVHCAWAFGPKQSSRIKINVRKKSGLNAWGEFYRIAITKETGGGGLK